AVEAAATRVLANGLRTADLGGAVGTEEMGQAVVEALDC
ncbi:MAG: 3-isopropylmalate dehydrogenase, partial [Gemmatimonadota bacterium]|nr:3-isopropylmalate dehydrogenase [Gemmatimonadota bacterium]